MTTGDQGPASLEGISAESKREIFSSVANSAVEASTGSDSASIPSTCPNELTKTVLEPGVVPNCTVNTVNKVAGSGGCFGSLFPRCLRSKVDDSQEQKAPKPKTKVKYSSVGDLSDTFYEEQNPGRRFYDVPSYGSGDVYRSARASQRHFREWL